MTLGICGPSQPELCICHNVSDSCTGNISSLFLGLILLSMLSSPRTESEVRQKSILL